MEEISSKFKGIELAVIDPEQKDAGFLKGMKSGILNIMLGDRQGFTVIGPATIIKEIKKDPNKIELFTKETKSKKKKR
jgi:hypothetical protein